MKAAVLRECASVPNCRNDGIVYQNKTVAEDGPGRGNNCPLRLMGQAADLVQVNADINRGFRRRCVLHIALRRRGRRRGGRGAAPPREAAAAAGGSCFQKMPA